MESLNRTWIGLALVAFGSAPTALACDAFLVSHAVVAKNFDFASGAGLIMVNKRGLSKKALVNIPGVTAASWTAKYGSITFNHVARELPQGGVNEKGLVAEVLMLDSAQYPAPGSVPAVGEMQWVQYQLDLYGSTQEVLDHLLVHDLAIAKEVANVHYLICDKGGDCAAVDPIAGQIVTYANSVLPFPVQTNDAYAGLATYTQGVIQAGGCATIPDTHLSQDRFAKVACALGLGESPARPMHQDPVSEAVSILDSVAIFPGQPDIGTNEITAWSIAYDLEHMKIYYKTHDAPQLRAIDIPGFDYSCAKPVQILDVNQAGTGSGNMNSRFKDYTEDANRSLVTESLTDKDDGIVLPKAAIDNLAAYPDSAIACASAR